MTVCNSCRYCEGLCAVFPAMEMRRAFSDGDLNYFANLCHACGACYTPTASFSPPHEFNVNVPQKPGRLARAILGGLRLAARILRPVRAQTGIVISLICALSVAAFIFGFAALNDRAVLTGVHTGPGAFYALMPHNAMAALFGAAFSLCHPCAHDGLARLLARHWRARGHPDRSALALAGDEGCRTAALSRWRRASAASTKTSARPIIAGSIITSRFYGFLLCFCVNLRRHALSLSFGPRGALCLVGSAGATRHARRHRSRDRADRIARGEIKNATPRSSTPTVPAWMLPSR